MPPIPMSTTFARISASWPARRAASSPASVCRRLVWTQRMGSFIHQPSSAAALFTISIRIDNDFVVMPVILCEIERDRSIYLLSSGGSHSGVPSFRIGMMFRVAVDQTIDCIRLLYVMRLDGEERWALSY